MRKLKDLRESITNIRSIFEDNAFKGEAIKDKAEPQRLPIIKKIAEKVRTKFRGSEPLPSNPKLVTSDKEKEDTLNAEQLEKPLPSVPVSPFSAENYNQAMRKLETKWSKVQEDIKKMQEQQKELSSPFSDRILKNDINELKQRFFKEVSYFFKDYKVPLETVANYFEENTSDSVEGLHQLLHNQSLAETTEESSKTKEDFLGNETENTDEPV